MIIHEKSEEFHPESALAYGGSMIMLYFAVAIMIWMSWGIVYDETLAGVINPKIIAGDVSKQTAEAIEWNVQILKYCVPVMLIFGFVFAINWAIYKTGGGMATYSTFYWGMLAFFIFTAGGLIMAFFGGYFIDIMHDDVGHNRLDGDVYNTLNAKGKAMYDQMQDGNIYWFINMYYLICDCMPVLGAVIWGQSIVKRVRVAQYQYV